MSLRSPDARWLALLATAWIAAGASADDGRTAQEIDACVRGNFPQDSSVQTISLVSVDRIGAESASRAKLHWKRDGDGRHMLMMRFHEPQDQRGAGMLMLQKQRRADIFSYLPALGKVKRVSAHMAGSSMFGTDFSYEDFERLQGMASTDPMQRLEDDAVGERPTYVLQIEPAPESESSYQRIVSWIDRERCVTLRSEYYERDDAPRKVMTATPDRVTEENGIWVAREVRMRDERDSTETTLVVHEIDVGAKIPRKIFSTRELESGGR